MAVQKLHVEKRNIGHTGAEMVLCHQDGVQKGRCKAQEMCHGGQGVMMHSCSFALWGWCSDDATVGC